MTPRILTINGERFVQLEVFPYKTRYVLSVTDTEYILWLGRRWDCSTATAADVCSTAPVWQREEGEGEG